MNTLVYSGTSNTQFAISMLWRLGFIGLITYFYFQYDDNPTLITVLICICAFLFLFWGNSEIYVYQDKVIQKDTSILTAVFRIGIRKFDIADIKSAFIEPEKIRADSSASEIGVGLFIKFILPQRRYYNYNSKTTKICLELKNEKIKILVTSLDKDAVQEIITAINHQVY